MPAQLSNVAIQQFRDQFENAYQASAQLRDTCQQIMNARGSSFNWPLQGASSMVPRLTPQSLIPAQSNDYSQVQTQFTNWIHNLPVDIYQQHELIVDVVAALGVTHAEAAGRREDQFLLDALYKAVTTPPPAQALPDQEPAWLVKAEIGNLNTANPGDPVNLNINKIMAAAAFLDRANVPQEERYLTVNAQMKHALMTQDQTASILFNNFKPLTDNRFPEFGGFKVITLGNRPEGGIKLREQGSLAAPTGNATAIAWHKRSLGSVYSMNPVTEVEWSPTHQSWLTISRLRMGASALLGIGICFIDCDDNKSATDSAKPLF